MLARNWDCWRHNHESVQYLLDPFLCERVWSEHKTTVWEEAMSCDTHCKCFFCKNQSSNLRSVMLELTIWVTSKPDYQFLHQVTHWSWTWMSNFSQDSSGSHFPDGSFKNGIKQPSFFRASQRIKVTFELHKSMDQQYFECMATNLTFEPLQSKWSRASEGNNQAKFPPIKKNWS